MQLSTFIRYCNMAVTSARFTALRVVGALTLGSSNDLYLTRYAAKKVMISGDGTGATTNAGWIDGYSGISGFADRWVSTVTPASTNYALQAGATITTLNSTSSTRISVNDSIVANASSTGLEIADNKTLKIGSGSGTSAGWTLGYQGTSGYSAIWSTGVTPNTSNYALLTNGGGTYLSGTTSSNLGVNGTTIATVTGSGLDITGALGATGSVTINGEYVTKSNSNVGIKFTKADGTQKWNIFNRSDISDGLDIYSNAGGTHCFRITQAGVVTLPQGKLSFPATQNASADANTLDDYEEGTWTPTYKTTGTDFSSVTYAIAAGKYTKVGRMVTVVGLLRTSSITAGGATGTVLIGGLPFTSSSSNDDYATVPIGTSSGFAVNHPSTGRASAGTTSLELLYRDASDGATTDLAISDLATGASANTLSFSCTYHV